MDYIQIGAYEVPYPNSFKLSKVPNIVAEIDTMKGTVADVNGMKYADTELQWDTLRAEDMEKLLNATNNIVFDLYPYDVTGERIRLRAIKKSFEFTKTQFRFEDGTRVWEDVTLEVSFPDVY